MTMPRRALRRAFFAGAIAWAVAQPLAAWTSGTSASTLSRSLAAGVYWLGGAVCHQHPERSFSAGAVVMPVCARCTGLYAGGALGAMVIPFAARGRATPRRTLRTALLASAVPAAVSILFEWTTGQMPGAWIRALTGLPIGVAVTWVVQSGTVPEVN